MVTVRMALDEPETPDRLNDRLTALVACAAALVILRCVPLRAILAAARTVKRTTQTTPGPADLARLDTACQWAARVFPCRFACMEESLAGFLFASAHRWRTDWCIGARIAPFQAHAWLEPNHHHTAETAAYHAIIRT